MTTNLKMTQSEFSFSCLTRFPTKVILLLFISSHIISRTGESTSALFNDLN